MALARASERKQKRWENLAIHRLHITLHVMATTNEIMMNELQVVSVTSFGFVTAQRHLMHLNYVKKGGRQTQENKEVL